MSFTHWLHSDMQGVDGEGRNRCKLPIFFTKSATFWTFPHWKSRFSIGALCSASKFGKLGRSREDVVCDGQQLSHSWVSGVVWLCARQSKPKQSGRFRWHCRFAWDKRRRIHFCQKHRHLSERSQQYLQCFSVRNQRLSIWKHWRKE